ncbi:MAG: phosphoserine phosphatase SerB [Candidatus Altiarchaeota archaeon]
MRQKYLVVSIIGLDRPGLLSDFTKVIADLNVNIIDIGQVTSYGILSLYLLLDPTNSKTKSDKIKELLKKKAQELKVNAIISGLGELGPHSLPQKEDLQTITVIGTDRPGIVYNIAETLRKNDINIERINMIARGEFFAMELLTGRVEPVDLMHLRKTLRAKGKDLGLDIIVQPEDVFRRRKNLIVFDMDSTIVDGEVIDDLAEEVGLGSEVSEITQAGLRGEIDFEEGLRRRVKMLAGTHVSTLEKIADAIKLTPGSEELILTLKEMGFKTALVSGGFTFFAERLKEKFGFDYAFANELEIKDGILTGRILGKIVDRQRKGEIVDELCRMENLTTESCVAIGDGANDSIMLKNAGLGLAFKAKDILAEVADGSIDNSNLLSILYCMGIKRRSDGNGMRNM